MKETALHMIVGAMLGFWLASWAWSDTAKATAQIQTEALEQIEVARNLNKGCIAALGRLIEAGKNR